MTAFGQVIPPLSRGTLAWRHGSVDECRWKESEARDKGSAAELFGFVLFFVEMSWTVALHGP